MRRPSRPSSRKSARHATGYKRSRKPKPGAAVDSAKPASITRLPRHTAQRLQKPRRYEPAYSAGADSPAARFADVSIAARVAKAAFIRSTSASDISSRLISELRAAALTRMSSSSLSCMACVSRVWVFWITNTIRKVTIVVAVLMTSCQVSDQPKIGPQAAQRRTAAIASRNVDDRPTCRSTQRANRAKSGVAWVSPSAPQLSGWDNEYQPSLSSLRMKRAAVECGSANRRGERGLEHDPIKSKHFFVSPAGRGPRPLFVTLPSPRLSVAMDRRCLARGRFHHDDHTRSDRALARESASRHRSGSCRYYMRLVRDGLPPDRPAMSLTSVRKVSGGS